MKKVQFGLKKNNLVQMVLLLGLFSFLCADYYLGSIPLARVSDFS